jgi:sugar diacid utilization regulator
MCAMQENRQVLALLEQLSDLCSLFALSMVMSDGRDEREILDLAVASVASLTSCRPIASTLAGDPAGLRSPQDAPLGHPELSAQVLALGGNDGPVSGTGSAWGRAYALRAVGGVAGHLVVAADTEPPPDELLLLQMLAQHTGRALATTALHRRDGATAAQLRSLNTRLAEVNDRLAASVEDLEQRRKVHETFSAEAAAGTGEAGIAAGLHRLTGLGVAVEDRFGNLRAWAGPSRPEPYPRPPTHRRSALLAEAGRSPGPYRDADRLLSLARSRDEVLGVLVLHDPHHRVGEPDLFAVEQGTVVLSVELAHQRALAESELRLRRDLVEDLLTGTDEASALARSQALGHDLRPEHRVAVIRWPAAPSENSLVRAVEQAVTRVLETGVLMARRPGGVVLIAPGPELPDTGRRWVELHRTVTRSLRGTSGAIGVGGICAGPAQVPKSYAQANRALRIRLRSSAPAGVTLYDELGVYRLLSSDGNDDEVRQYVREWLGPLLDYDATSRSDLVTTLWQYLECGGNYDATARALLIHRSTLRYRLRRIREISGLDIGAVNTRLNLHIATRARQVLRDLS